MEISTEDRETLEHLEQELWREETRFDTQRMNELIAPDFFEFGRSGRVWQRQDTLAAVPYTKDVVPPLPEFHIRLLDENIAQVTYDSAFIADASHPEYAIILKFDCYQHLKAWMDSPIRQSWIDKAQPLVQSEQKVQVLTGLETWFTLPGKLVQRHQNVTKWQF